MQGIDLERKGKELATEMDAYVSEHFEELAEKFVKCFSEYCDEIAAMQREGKKGAIAYIHFSVLRTNILLKKHEIRIDAYDENWYLDSVECSCNYPVEEIYSYLEKYGDCVEALWKKTQGVNKLADVNKKIFDMSNMYLFYVAELIRIGMKRIKNTDSYSGFKRADCFIVGIGGFMDRFDILYKEDCTLKDSATVKRFLQSGQQRVFSHEIDQKLDLSKGNYEDLEFQYSSFKECDFSQSNFSKSRFLFCDFADAELRDIKMTKTKLFDVNFSGARLENVDFSGAKLKCISFQGAKLKNVNFSNALIVEDINFENAKIENCMLPESR